MDMNHPSGDTLAVQARLYDVLAALHRRFGPHTVWMGAEYALRSALERREPFSTGSLGLDLVLGGLPGGKITEIAGPDGSGVEMIGLAALAACQKAGGLAVLVDPEGSLDPDALAALSVDVERLILAYPSTAVAAWTIMTALCRASAADLVLIASFPSLLALPRAGWGTSPYPLSALPKRLMRLSATLRGRTTAVVLLNRTTFLQDERRLLDDRLETVGSHVVAQVSAVRVGLSPPCLVMTPDGSNLYVRTRAVVVKDRGRTHTLSLPFTISTTGPCRPYELVELGLQAGCLVTTPLGIVFQGAVLGRSIDRAARALVDDTTLATRIEEHVCALWPDAVRQREATGR
jgi:recombination protein RecA